MFVVIQFTVSKLIKRLAPSFHTLQPFLLGPCGTDTVYFNSPHWVPTGFKPKQTRSGRENPEHHVQVSLFYSSSLFLGYEWSLDWDFCEIQVFAPQLCVHHSETCRKEEEWPVPVVHNPQPATSVHPTLSLSVQANRGESFQCPAGKW